VTARPRRSRARGREKARSRRGPTAARRARRARQDRARRPAARRGAPRSRRWAAHACCAPPPSRTASELDPRQGAGWSHRVRASPGLHRRAHPPPPRPEAGPGDPAHDRARLRAVTDLTPSRAHRAHRLRCARGDGGTRTASINGRWWRSRRLVTLSNRGISRALRSGTPWRDLVGIVAGVPCWIRVPRRLDRRGGHECGDDRLGRFVELQARAGCHVRGVRLRAMLRLALSGSGAGGRHHG